MKNILCYGDSNTWGYNPETFDRYAFEERWTGILSAKMPECRILEAGLNGRNTAVADGLEPWRNGAEYLPMTLKTHDPLDLLVIMLGTNDVKRRFHLTSGEIVQGMERLIDIVQFPAYWGGRSQPELLIIAPPPLNGQELIGSPMADQFDAESAVVSCELAPRYAALAKRKGCYFWDASVLGKMGGADGVHLDRVGHAAMAAAMEKLLRKILFAD